MKSAWATQETLSTYPSDPTRPPERQCWVSVGLVMSGTICLPNDHPNTATARVLAPLHSVSHSSLPIPYSYTCHSLNRKHNPTHDTILGDSYSPSETHFRVPTSGHSWLTAEYWTCVKYSIFFLLAL